MLLHSGRRHLTLPTGRLRASRGIRGTLPRAWLSLAGTRLLALLAVLHPGVAHADAADFQGMPGMWKVQLRIQHRGRIGPSSEYWFCADEGSDPMDSYAAVDLPELQACRRQSVRRSTTALAWRLECHARLAGQGTLSFDSAEHYQGRIDLPLLDEQIHIEARHYAACTGPSD